MLLRTREETPEEVIGFIDACRELLAPDLSTLTPQIDIGCYAGKRRQLPWYLLAVALLARKGYTVMLHGAHEPGSGRLYASKALPLLGLPPATDIPHAKSQLAQVGVTYLDLSHLLSPLNKLIKLREFFWFALMCEYLSKAIESHLGQMLRTRCLSYAP